MNDRRTTSRFNGRFNGCCNGSLAALFVILCCCFWFLGSSVGSAIAVDRITGPQAVERMKQVLGDPQTFEDDMKNSTQDFIQDHFGSMAIATAFSIAIRMRS